MAQFDLHRLTNSTLVVDLQTDLIGLDESRIVAPLLDAKRYTSFPALTPIVAFEKAEWVVTVQRLAAVERRQLGQPVGDLREWQDDLLRALDILTRGF